MVPLQRKADSSLARSERGRAERTRKNTRTKPAIAGASYARIQYLFNKPLSGQVVQNPAGRFLYRFRIRADLDLWGLWSFIGVGDAREVGDLAGQRLLVEALHIP